MLKIVRWKQKTSGKGEVIKTHPVHLIRFQKNANLDVKKCEQQIINSLETEFAL